MFLGIGVPGCWAVLYDMPYYADLSAHMKFSGLGLRNPGVRLAFLKPGPCGDSKTCWIGVLHVSSVPFRCTVNPEIFVRILFSRIALKDVFATLKFAKRA